MAEKEDVEIRREKVLIKFLSLTKEGKYASVDKSSLPYSRIKEETEEVDICQEMYYNLA